MKQTVEKRKPSGIVDYIALMLTTWGVGYIPGAPGTYGSAVGVLIYFGILFIEGLLAFNYFSSKHPEFLHIEYSWIFSSPEINVAIWSANAVLLSGFCLAGIWASGRSIPLLGSSDPSEAVVDEVMGQLITLCFIPFSVSWPFILAGFLLFRLFDIWKPFPVRTLEILPGGLGVCADDIVAGVYAGICLAVGNAIYLAI